jgi:hypothetical protein
MNIVTQEQMERVQELLDELASQPINRESKWQQLISQVDAASRTEEGILFLYDQVEAFDRAGFFKGTPWEDPRGLIPFLVKGTLTAPAPSNIVEIISELRMLKIAKGAYASKQITASEASEFLEDMLVASFDLAYRGPTENLRLNVSTGDLKRIRRLFDFILSNYSFPQLKRKLAEEIETIAAQRPIITYRLEELILLVKEQIELDPEQDADRRLLYFVNAAFHPTSLAKEYPEPDAYIRMIQEAPREILAAECTEMGQKLQSTGLVSAHQLILFQFLTEQDSDLISELLHLNDHGKADFEKHRELVIRLIRDFILDTNKQAVYGLKRMLERTLLSRKPVRNAIQRLITIQVTSKDCRKHPKEYSSTP